MNAQNWNFPAHLLPAEPTSLDLTAQLQIAVISLVCRCESTMDERVAYKLTVAEMTRIPK